MHIEIKVSTAETAAEAVADLGLGPAPDFLGAYFTQGHEADGIVRALASLNARALHGATSCRGVLSAAGMTAGGTVLGAFAVYDPDGDYGTGLAAKGEHPRASARRAIGEALTAAGRRGEVPDLVWLATSPGEEEAVIAGIHDEVGADVPILGGTAADDGAEGRWRVLSVAGALADGIVVSVLFPSQPLNFAFHSGYAPTECRAVATRTEGRRLLSLGDRPAADVYAAWMGNPAWAARNGMVSKVIAETSLAPLGLPASSVAQVPYYRLVHPVAVHADGSLELFASVAEGEEVVLMRGSADGLTARAGRVVRRSVDAGRQRAAPLGALVVYCGGAMMAVPDRMDEVAADIARALGGAPFLGVFTFGEQGRMGDGDNRHANLMISCVTFGVGDA